MGLKEQLDTIARNYEKRAMVFRELIRVINDGLQGTGVIKVARFFVERGNKTASRKEIGVGLGIPQATVAYFLTRWTKVGLVEKTISYGNVVTYCLQDITGERP